MRSRSNTAFPVLFNDRFQLTCDTVQSLVPGNFFEFSFALFSDAFQRFFQAERVVPDPHSCRGSPAVALLRMPRIWENTNSFFRNRFAFFTHFYQTAEGAAHRAGDRMFCPAFLFEFFNLFGKRQVRKTRRGSCCGSQCPSFHKCPSRDGQIYDSVRHLDFLS